MSFHLIRYLLFVFLREGGGETGIVAVLVSHFCGCCLQRLSSVLLLLATCDVMMIWNGSSQYARLQLTDYPLAALMAWLSIHIQTVSHPIKFDVIYTLARWICVVCRHSCLVKLHSRVFACSKWGNSCTTALICFIFWIGWGKGLLEYVKTEIKTKNKQSRQLELVILFRIWP